MSNVEEALAPLVAKERDLMSHIKNIKECLEMLREEKNKLLIEQLQIESLIAERTAGRTKKMKLTPKVQNSPPDDVKDINQQDMDLSVSDALCDMLPESFFDDDDDDEEDDTGAGKRNEGENIAYKFNEYSMLGFEGNKDSDNEENLLGF